jgi:ribosomal protein L19
MRCLIQTLEREHQERAAQQKQIPLPSSFRAGDVLEVRLVVPEAGRAVYTYRGVCIGRANKGPRSWLKMYNVFPDAGGVVQHLPM